MHRHAVSATILEHELSELRLLVERQMGVLLQSSNEALIPVLAAHLESHQLSSASELLNGLRDSELKLDLEPLIEPLLDSTTGFGRHPAALSAFRGIVLPELRQRKLNQDSKSLRVWSAGCATGEEAYEVAMSICEETNGDGGWTIQVVGTDIRPCALQVAERGLYPIKDLVTLPPEQLQSHFSRVGDHLLVKPRLRSLVAFTTMNLAHPSYLGRYDAIFCMDVLPQFSMAQRIALTQRMQLYLEPGGYLLLGDGEKLPAAEMSLQPELDGKYIFYRKPMAASAAGN